MEIVADGQETEITARLDRREADIEFQHAMRTAIKAGVEHAPIGIVKDDTPISPMHFQQSPRSSWCSSSAGLCADMGEPHNGRFA